MKDSELIAHFSEGDDAEDFFSEIDDTNEDKKSEKLHLTMIPSQLNTVDANPE